MLQKISKLKKDSQKPTKAQKKTETLENKYKGSLLSQKILKETLEEDTKPSIGAIIFLIGCWALIVECFILVIIIFF